MALLPKDLQRFSIDGQNVVPQYIKPTKSVLELAEQILGCFRFSPDDTYGTLTDALEPLCLQSQRHRLIKGMIHILESRLEFGESQDIDPVLLREELFAKAAQVDAAAFLKMDWREPIAAEICEKYHIKREDLEDSIYSDLKDERKILSFEDLEPEDLVSEYNMTLARSLLLYARKLTFTVDLGKTTAQSLRRLFQSLRFFNLLFEAQPLTETIWQFSVDGPSAILPQPQKYAMSLASFLPTLYSFSVWHATAEIYMDEHVYSWQHTPDAFEPPLMRHPERIPEEAGQLSQRIVQIDPEWEISKDYPVLMMGPQCAWVPDFSIRNKMTKKVAHIEVLGYWRADYLNRRLELLKKAPKNLILVLSDRLKLDEAAIQKTPVSIITFKRTPRPQDVIKIAETCAIKE